MYACLQGLITQPAAVPIKMLSTFSRMGAVRPWVGALAVQQRALASGRARAERGPSAPSSTSAAAAVEASAGPVHAVDDVTGLPSTAYGRVMSSQANYFRVRLHGTPEGAESTQVELLCKARSLMRKMGKYVLVGDNVTIINIDWRDNRGLVAEVQPRSSEIMNPKMANVDHFALVFALADPPPEAFQITRFLVSAESVGIPCSILLNKADLVSPEVVAAQVARMSTWGYKAIPISVESGEGMQELRQQLGDRCTVLAGPSGVGKSSIINMLRSIAFDDKQKRRLENFAEAMATEYDWRNIDSDDDGTEDDEHDEDSDSDGDAAATTTNGTTPTTTTTITSSSSSSSNSSQNGTDASTADASTEDASTADLSTAGASAHTTTVNATAGGVASGRADTGGSASGNAPSAPAHASAVGGAGLSRDVLGVQHSSGDRRPAPTASLTAPSWMKRNDDIYGAQVTAASIQSNFPEIAHIQAEHACSFANCTHLHEPGCAVRFEPWERYEFYVRLREEVVDRQQIENTKLQMQKRRRQGQTKTAKRTGGIDVQTVRLDPKKHRRVPRTERKLQIKDMMGDLADDL